MAKRFNLKRKHVPPKAVKSTSDTSSNVTSDLLGLKSGPKRPAKTTVHLVADKEKPIKFSEETQDLPLKVSNSKTGWKKLETYRKHKTPDRLDELKGKQFLVADYMCRLAKESNCTVNPTFSVKVGQVRDTLQIPRNQFSKIIDRLKKKNVIITSDLSKDKQTIKYKLNSLIYYSYLS